MPIFPYDEEERRRRSLTPGINPNAPSPPRLPEISMPRRVSPPPMTNIPGDVEMPGSTNPAPSMGEARDVYLKGTPGRGKSALLGALRGFAGGGGLGGAITGGIYGAADPRGLREMEFNQRVMPRIREEEAYQGQQRALGLQEQEHRMAIDLNRARIGQIGAENVARASELDLRRENAAREASLTRSQIDLNAARAEAERAGRPVYQDLVDTDGKIRKYQVFPGGRKVAVGESGAAAISQKGIQSRERIAGQREAGVSARAAERQGAARAKPGSKGAASKEDIDEAFRRAGGHKAGWTLKGMKKHFKDQGYTVPE